MSWVWAVVAAALIQYVLAEALGSFLVAARWLVRHSVRRLPLEWRNRYEAEWLAELEAVPGNGLLKLLWAAQLRAGAARTAQVLEDVQARARPEATEERVSFVQEELFSLAPSTGPPLTARERQVASLAAEGLSKREIADELFVTLKTVEWHLHHAYRKMRGDSPGRGTVEGG
jgi:ATP/maltotriose-dependent transcriptional regulator MalT